MDSDSNKRKKVSDSSIRKSKKVNMRAEIFSKSLNIGGQRNLVLNSRIDFHAAERLLATINAHTQLSDHNRDCWIMDYGANGHICINPKWLLNPIVLSNKDLHLCLVDGKKVKVKAFGDVYLKFDQGRFIIKRVTCATKLNMNIISVAKMHDEGCKILFDDHVTIMRENITLYNGRQHQGLFEFFLSLLDLE